MKNFDEFRASLTSSHMKEWTREINAVKLKVTLPLDASTIDEFISYVAQMNFELTLKLLREYHHWSRE